MKTRTLQEIFDVVIKNGYYCSNKLYSRSYMCHSLCVACMHGVITEQEYRKAILFFRTHTASSPIIIQALNYFIQTPYLSASIINKCLTPISIPMELN